MLIAMPNCGNIMGNKMTIGITPESVEPVSGYRGTTEQLINALDAMPIRGGISGQVVAAEAAIVIRALSATLTASQAETAAAYDLVAAKLSANIPPSLAAYVQQSIRAMAPADSKAVLDRMLAGARADGMREAASLLFSVVSHLPLGRIYSYRNGWTDGVSDYANQSHATILAAIPKGKDHE